MSPNIAALLPQRANANGDLVRRGRFLEVTFLLEIGASAYLVRIHRGRIETMDPGPHVEPRWTFAVRASATAWAQFWQALPPPGGHDQKAMLKGGELRLEGDLHPFMANLRYFKELLALPRAAGAHEGR